jgi:glycosyltransferase involved in cell wall biosynthesis
MRITLPPAFEVIAQGVSGGTGGALCCAAVGRPRILINATSLSEGGGGRSYLLNLLRELDRDPRGFDFTVLALEGQLPAEAVGRHALRELWLPGTARTIFRVLYEQSLLPLVAGRFDLLYCPADLTPLWGWTPTVVALRNFNIYDRRFYDDARTRILFRLVRLGLLRGGRAVCPSQAAARAIGRELGIAKERITVVHHGISAEVFEHEVAPPPDAAPYLFLPANLERHKNFEVLFEGLLRVENRDLELWIAGGDQLDPEWARHLRRMVDSMGLGSRVRFLGHVPYAEILRYYRGALALVFPSLLETFGHPLLEAMLAGTPIIASDIPSFHEVAEDAALYFPPGDPEQLAAAIERVRRNPAATSERVERGRRRVEQFTWRRSLDRLCAVFEDLLRERARA